MQMAVWLVALSLAPAGLRAQQTNPSQSGPPPAEAEGARVVALRVVNESGQVLQENPLGLPLAIGQPLDAQDIRESLRVLYRSGRYADVRADSAPAAGGVRVDFVVRENIFINVVRVNGLREPPSEPLAIAAMRLQPGEAFRESDMKEALENLRQTLREDGFYRAQVRYDTAPHPETLQMDITVAVEPGPRARLGTLALDNQTEMSDAELRARSKLKPGHEITSGRLSRAAERVRKLLVKRGHLAARVQVRRGDYDVTSATLPVTLEVHAAPRVRVAVDGAKIPQKDLRRLLPIYEEGAVDEDLLQEGRRAIRDYLERQGYFDAQVRYFTGEPVAPAAAPGRKQPPEQVIMYQVDRGARRRLLGVAFEGNRYFNDDLLSGRLRLLPAAFLSPGRFSRRLMDDDATSIRDLYHANGFLQAEVKGELIEDYHGHEGDLFVRFHITEGAQTRVAELKLEGNHALSDDALQAVIGSTAGQPYSDFNLASDRDNILALYYNEGFPEARFTSSAEPTGDAPAKGAGEGPRVRLVYQINEGAQIRVARVLPGGYEHTRPKVVAREVQIKAGEPLREGDVVETQRRLYNLGIFSRVSIAPQNPSGTDPDKTVVVLVDEAKRYTIGYGFGIEVQRLGSGGAGPVSGEFRASPRGLFEITKANLTGRADTLSFKGRASTLQGRGLLSYLAPNYFGRPEFSLQLTGFVDKTRDIQTFTSVRYEGSLQLAQRITPFSSFLYRYAYRKVQATDLQVSPDQVPLFNQPTKVSEFGVTWFRERRDNPADASHGNFNDVDVSLAGKPIGSNASFLRVFLQNSSFHPIGRRLVFARSFRFGVQTPVGDTLSNEIPLPERFFAGGGTSLRGFGLNQAGPRDPLTGFPVGGLALLALNQELRFPMRLPFVGNKLGGAMFLDAGNVFSRVGRIALRTAPPEPVFNASAGNQCQFNCTNELNYMSYTIGLGFRYATPIGPVRVDLGYQLNPARFLVPDGIGGLRATRLPHFQFFFNLGAIF